MAWNSYRSSPFPLNYERISRELADRKIMKGIRNRDHVVVHRPNVVAYRVADDAVTLKLHATEIVTWYANGDRLFNGGGWSSSQMTRHWWWQAARFGVWNGRPNKWSAQYMKCRIDGYEYPFNGRLRVDRQGLKLESDEPDTPIMKRLPNAEAKAYRAHVRAMLRTHYQPHCNMLSTMDWQEKYRNGEVPNRVMYNNITTIEKGDVDLDLLDAVLWTYRWDRNPSHPFVLFMSWAMKQVDSHISSNQMFDEFPYQPKEK